MAWFSRIFKKKSTPQNRRHTEKHKRTYRDKPSIINSSNSKRTIDNENEPHKRKSHNNMLNREMKNEIKNEVKNEMKKIKIPIDELEERIEALEIEYQKSNKKNDNMKTKINSSHNDEKISDKQNNNNAEKQKSIKKILYCDFQDPTSTEMKFKDREKSDWYLEEHSNGEYLLNSKDDLVNEPEKVQIYKDLYNNVDDWEHDKKIKIIKKPVYKKKNDKTAELIKKGEIGFE